MSLIRKSSVLLVALLAFGALRLPFEEGLSHELRADGLFPPELQIGTREKIGQTFSSVALSGLRTLVATFLNLRAYSYFSEQKWDDIEDAYNTIVDLAPRTRYYWETGAWHMAYNAASYYQHKSDLPPLRRREAWRSSIHKGRQFLERGCRNNPEDWNLPAQLGLMLLDPNKFVAFRDLDQVFIAAAEAYEKAEETGKAPAYVSRFHLYAVARIKGREKEALEMARGIYAEGPKTRTPTLVMLLLVLEARDDPGMDVEGRAIELFGNPKKAYDAICLYWMRTRERMPVDGLARALVALESRLEVPPDQSIFKRTTPVEEDGLWH